MIKRFVEFIRRINFDKCMNFVLAASHKASIIYGFAVGATLILFFMMGTMSFIVDNQSLVGPGALVIGMAAAITWFVKRDKEMRKQLNEQNERLIRSQNERIKELEIELKELRNQKSNA